MSTPKNLYRTDITIWSEYDPSESDLQTLARDATSGEAYCSKQTSTLVEEPQTDPAWDGTEFFGTFNLE